MSDSVITLQDISKSYRLFRNSSYRLLNVLGCPVPKSSYKELVALQQLSLQVPRGQRLGIIGANGAGKSTLLKLVAGLLKPTSGTVRVEGQVQALMELGTGFHPDFSGRDNVLSSLAYRGVTSQAAERALEDIVAFAELGQAIDRPLNTYSAGMYARLAFAVATQLQPDILIIDEILGAGDAYFAGKCMERMRALASTKGATVLFVSHDINAVQALCERVVWIKDGRLAMDGDPLAVARAYYKEVQEEHNRRLAECTHKTGAPYASSDTSVGHRGMPDAGMVVTPRIEAVRLVDADRQPVAGIQEGGELIVEVDYATPIALVHPMVGMSVYLLDGKPYCRALTNLDQTDLPRIQGRGTIRFVFRPFAAGAGEYVISVSLFKHINLQYHERSELYDSHDRAYRFRVWKPLGTVLDTGLVRMPYRIEHMAGGNLSRAVSR